MSPVPEPLPEFFDMAVTRRVGTDCTIGFEGRTYSVPFALVGRSVEVRGCARHVQILAGILRRMGCQIGHRSIVTEPMQVFDWKAVDFGNDCIIDGIPQLHTIENMQLEVKQSDIRDGSAVNFGATVMGGSLIERNTTLLPLDLVLIQIMIPMSVP